MSATTPLPLLMPPLAGQRWSCHSCGQCCRDLVGHLFAEDVRRLDQQQWQGELEVEPYVRAAGQWVLNKHHDGRCVFLDDQQRCRIHSKFGEQAKPLACRIFPFSVRPVKGAWQVAFRFDCPSAASSKGEACDRHRQWLERIVGRMKHSGTVDDDTAELSAGLMATKAETDALLDHYVRWFRQGDVPLHARLTGAARITGTLAAAKFDTVRGGRFTELLDLLFGAIETDSVEEPTDRQRGLLRQLVMAHSEHVSLATLQAGRRASLKTRWQQLKKARRFRRGQGQVPPIPGLQGSATFSDVENKELCPQSAPRCADLMTRYVMARLQSRSVFGDGYFNWRVFDGLTALWLSVATIGWLARHHACVASRQTAEFEDLAWAVGIVDRAATRLPILGTTAERARVAYLRLDDGVARLLHRWPICGTAQWT